MCWSIRDRLGDQWGRRSLRSPIAQDLLTESAILNQVILTHRVMTDERDAGTVSH